MTNEELNTALYKKVFRSNSLQRAFRTSEVSK